MALIKDNELQGDSYAQVGDGESLPADGDVIVPLAMWLEQRDALAARGTKIGVRLKSDESPDAIADDLSSLDVVALEFPAFRDGRAYSHARRLRERYGYAGEIRAVGDVLMEQIHFMLRTGFNAFELGGDDPLGDFRAATEDFSVWYQPTGDGRPTAVQLRHRRG